MCTVITLLKVMAVLCFATALLGLLAFAYLVWFFAVALKGADADPHW